MVGSDKDKALVKSLKESDSSAYKEIFEKIIGVAASILIFIAQKLILNPAIEKIPTFDAVEDQFKLFANRKWEKRKIKLPDGSTIHPGNYSILKKNSL
jgi:hypothetical protein